MYLWPECAKAWHVFLDLADQWRDGALPRSEILVHVRELHPVDSPERRELYECLCAAARAVRGVHTEHRQERERQERRERAAQRR